MAVTSELLEFVASKISGIFCSPENLPFSNLKKAGGLRRKGFIYTLEAVIASTLFLTTVTMLIPANAPSGNTAAVQDTVQSALRSLDKSGELRDDLSVSGLESDIESFVPPGYSYRVQRTDVETESHYLSAPDEFYFDKSGGNAELQLWLEEASNLQVTFDGETVIQDRDSVGYVQETLPGTTGYLNFTGSAVGRFDFDSYSREGQLPEKGDTRTVSYILAGKNLTEIKVFLWLEDNR